MAYDVDRRPAEWLEEQVAQRERSIVLLLGCYFTAAAVTVLVWWSGQHLVALVLALATACFAVATNDSIAALRPWSVGRNAEAAVGEELNELRRDGYFVLHDVMFGGEGNLDHVVNGENGVFLIETKANRYEKHQLSKIKRQAKALSSVLGCWVTPVICAGVRKKTFVHWGVRITGRGMLADAIRYAPHHRPPDPERWRRFGDSL